MKIISIPFQLVLLASLLITSCDTEHKGYTITPLTGDYRYYKGISEFYNCNDNVKYFVSKSGIYKQLEAQYSSLSIKNSDDIYIQVEGYIKSEELLGGIGSSEVLVVTKLISVDQNRGCEKAKRLGH